MGPWIVVKYGGSVGRTPWSSGLIYNVSDWEVKGSIFGTSNSFLCRKRRVKLVVEKEEPRVKENTNMKDKNKFWHKVSEGGTRVYTLFEFIAFPWIHPSKEEEEETGLDNSISRWCGAILQYCQNITLCEYEFWLWLKGIRWPEKEESFSDSHRNIEVGLFALCQIYKRRFFL